MVGEQPKAQNNTLEHVKPKILIVVDNHNWAWAKTMEDLAHCLWQYELEIMKCVDFKKKQDYSEYTAVYFRGYANAFIDRANEKKIPPFVSTLSTGGRALPVRLQEMEKYARRGLGIVVQNKKAYHECKLNRYDPVWIIPNGVNTNVYYPAQERPKSVYVGFAVNTRDDRAILKGVPFITEACKNINIPYAEANFDNPLSYEEMADWYRALTIYAQPSESEGCSNSVMEAMASGLPCLICEGVGYHGEVCRNGLLDPEGEVLFVERDPADIERKIKFLLSNDQAYRRISRNAREFAEAHSWKYIAPKYKEVFDHLHKEALKNKPLGRVGPVKLISDTLYKQSADNFVRRTELAKIIEKFMEDAKIKKDALGVITVLDLLGHYNPERSTEPRGFQHGFFNKADGDL